MKAKNKALLLSLFVFPGTGYIVVKEKTRAFIFIALAISTLSALTAEIYVKVTAIANKILSGDISNAPDVIMQQYAMADGIFSPLLVSIMSYALLFVWIFGAIDSYRLGKKINPPI